VSEFTTVCRVDDIDVEGGATALVAGRAVAVLRTFAGEIFALANYDPFSRASVLARGIVGTLERDGRTVDFVASPLHKQRFDLRTGRCLDDPTVAVDTYQVRIVDGTVLVGVCEGEGG
jgi:NAD(P)H-dependent nitrite reductase small subunit